jgi:hypothetical protein
MGVHNEQKKWGSAKPSFHLRMETVPLSETRCPFRLSEGGQSPQIQSSQVQYRQHPVEMVQNVFLFQIFNFYHKHPSAQ